MPTIVLEPSDIGLMEISLDLGRLEAGKLHEINVEVENPTEHSYEVASVTSISEQITIIEAPVEVKSKQKGTILFSLDIPMRMEPLDASLTIDGVFVIGSK